MPPAARSWPGPPGRPAAVLPPPPPGPAAPERRLQEPGTPGALGLGGPQTLSRVCAPPGAAALQPLGAPFPRPPLITALPPFPKCVAF